MAATSTLTLRRAVPKDAPRLAAMMLQAMQDKPVRVNYATNFAAPPKPNPFLKDGCAFDALQILQEQKIVQQITEMNSAPDCAFVVAETNDGYGKIPVGYLCYRLVDKGGADPYAAIDEICAADDATIGAALLDHAKGVVARENIARAVAVAPMGRHAFFQSQGFHLTQRLQPRDNIMEWQPDSQRQYCHITQRRSAKQRNKISF